MKRVYIKDIEAIETIEVQDISPTDKHYVLIRGNGQLCRAYNITGFWCFIPILHNGDGILGWETGPLKDLITSLTKEGFEIFELESKEALWEWMVQNHDLNV